MKNFINFLILLLSLSVSGQDTYLHCGKLIDTKSGKTLKEMTIIVSESKIIDVIKGYVDSNNNDDKTIDLKQKTVMPGLIDMHVHLEMQMSPSIYIESFI